MFTINAGNFWSYLLIFLIVYVFIYDLLYLLRYKQKDPLVIIPALLCWYFLLVYINALASDPNYYVRSGILTRIGVVILFIIHHFDTRIKRNSNAA